MLILIICLIAAATFFSYIHGLGLWLLLMIIHGIIYQQLGAGAEHLPFIAGMVVLVITFAKGQWSGISIKAMLTVLALIMLMCISTLQGIRLDVGLVTVLLYAKGFLLVLLLAGCIRDEKEMKIMTLYCLAGLTIGALAEFYQYETGNFFIKTIYDERAASLRGDPNDTAMLLVAGIPLAFYWVSINRKFFGKVFFATILAALLFGIILTASRGGFVSLLGIMLIMFIRRPSAKVFIVGIMLSAIFLAMSPKSYWERMDTLLTGREDHGSASLQHRAELQRVGLEMFLERPVLGVGPGNFGEAYAQHVGGIQASEVGGVAHNMYLEFFVENGFLGGLLLLYIFAQAILGLLRYDRFQGAETGRFGIGFSIALALGGMLFSGLFLSQAKNSVLWFMTGMGITAGLITREMKKKMKPALTRQK